jgi:predicted nucleic acid-binding protein
MSGRYLLDSNIVIALFAGDNNVLAAANEAEEVFIPTLLYRGNWVINGN